MLPKIQEAGGTLLFSKKVYAMKVMKRIYLACPYSHKDEKVRIERFEAVNKKAAELMQLGYCVFSPISHSHPISFYINNACDCSFWIQQDVEFIEWADELHILKLDGWDASRGVTIELKIAQALSKPIRFWEVL